ncbi:M1 family peptidase [Lacihabitans sp. LS3-19]|uniref:M1 family metallopeptidase n=1 Tax=Lacihabitans sp. LS3-19 TaxID=2487335 RepID=UPI0020CBD7F1|nr:M1 family metallopeptidase [Lacihabitans sp. LS3-19]MCP9770934.1 M1 family peptidase [Lacihabitans sp. LS3-19]
MKKTILFLLIGIRVLAQQTNPYNANTVFEQMGTALPTPNTYRTASGAPGKEYWQQKADYDIKVELDDESQRIKGSEKITYHNFSPDALTYLWLQLDQNHFSQNSDAKTTRQTSISHERGSTGAALKSLDNSTEKDFGHKIEKVTDKSGKPLKYTINGTMMRIDLPTSLLKGQNFVFNIDWNFNITDALVQRGRSGYEYFAKDGNYLYEMAQWFPRMCVYDDVTGWQNKQFLGQGEFALVFGDYNVSITVPNDMVVGATGELQNPKEVLSAIQIQRLSDAETSSTPIVIVNQSEAEEAEKGKPTGKKTWVYSAKNVRDFAFATSRKFIWDAMKVDVEGKKVWAMSLYPKEGNPLWGQYSTRLVAHTLTQYSKRTIAYPYPVAYSVHGPVGGMEYPMMSFNGARPLADGTYSEGTKNFLILVIIHEVGHNFFPMIVNSDERQWSWMDEGLNSFLEGVVCREWDRDFPADGIEPQHIVPYMKLDPAKQNSIMSSSDNILPGTFGPNAYSKPATGLNMLRETIMGRELFDYAFKEYARRWAFKHPTPADFFRTMEDASGVDLDWFWKGWFYGVDALDQGIAEVEWLQVDSQNPEVTKAEAKELADAKGKTISKMRDKTDIPQSVVEADPSMKDFYNTYDPYKVTENDKTKYQNYLESLGPEDRKMVENTKQYYVLNLKNKGGLVMPLIVQAQFEDGTTQDFRFPVEIWRLNNKEIKKTIVTDKKVAKFKLDPYFELPDIDDSDNVFPREPEKPTKFQLMKQQSRPQASNPMQDARKSDAAAVGGSGKN